jgi:DNA-binding CsgD family transcriptional regulator
VVNAKYVLLNNLQVRSQIYKMQKDYALSLSCMERYVEESKALNDAKRLKDIKNEVTSRQLLKLRAENELEKKKNEIIKERIYWTLSGSFLIILILIGLFRYYIFRKQKEAELVKARNKVMELEMEQKEAIITDVNSELQRAKERLRYLRLFLQTRNELLENIRDQIRKSYKIQGAEHITFLKQINTYISQYQIKQDAKNALSDDEKQNEEFMKRLKEKYPAITQVELRLATYLRADLSNKEIALLIGAQIKTIETNRYRLRKVLQLDADTDICQYLRQI